MHAHVFFVYVFVQIVCSRVLRLDPFKDRMFCMRVESVAGESVDVALPSGVELKAWLEACRLWEGKFYLNGSLGKLSRHRKKWKNRFLLLCGPDLQWASKEGSPWRGRVSVCARSLCVGFWVLGVCV
jgi:hypothetical protein